MTDRTQFEAMLEALINEDQETAKEIFHNIVVAKSREIYEELLSEDFASEEVEDKEDDEYKEEFGADDEEGADDSDSEEETDGEEDDIGGDATDDFIDDVSDDEETSDSDDLSSEEQSDRIMDLEDALEELKAEFEQLMAGEGDDDMGGDDMAGDMSGDMGADDMGGMGAADELEDESMFMREYVNKVSPPKHGDNGTNTKSIVAKPNRMGGTSANIAKSFSTEKGGTEGGLLKPSTTEENFGNVNVPGGKAGKSGFKKSEPGHGAEKKGRGETADNKKSIIGGK